MYVRFHCAISEIKYLFSGATKRLRPRGEYFYLSSDAASLLNFFFVQKYSYYGVLCKNIDSDIVSGMLPEAKENEAKQ